MSVYICASKRGKKIEKEELCWYNKNKKCGRFFFKKKKSSKIKLCGILFVFLSFMKKSFLCVNFIKSGQQEKTNVFLLLRLAFVSFFTRSP